MKQTISEWRERITTSLAQTREGRNYTALCPICGAKETAPSESDDKGKALVCGKVESHIITDHQDRIESEAAHQTRLRYLDELRKAIKATHGCDSAHLEAVPVHEVFRGKTAWEGDVEVFDVSHPTAKHCFAWGVRRDDDKGWDVTAVLGIPPVVAPQLAVKAAIVAHARQAAAQRPGKP